ncbi:MAG TPA: hypothetical protein VGD49_14275 [Longimicrobiales bacterium]
MSALTKHIRPIVVIVAVVALGSCGSSDDYWDYYPNHYPWYYNDWGAYTIVRSPARIVDRWTTRALQYRPYRGYAISRHNSPVIVHTATKGDDKLEVRLTPQEDGTTHVEVRVREGASASDKERARVLMGQILRDYR